MLFTSIEFWAAFILFLLFFALIRRFTRIGMMLYVTAASLAFYALSNGWFMLLLPAIAFFTWGMTRIMNKLEGITRKLLLSLIIIIDLLPLVFFKYATFIIDLWHDIVESNFSLGTIFVPVGVSFFTFQAISYTMDVYRKRFTDKVSLLKFFFYLTFFPLILAGPITRAEHFFAHFKKGQPYTVSAKVLYTGLWLIMLGLVKKLVVADYIAQYNNWIFDDPTAFTGFENLMGVLGYTIQIYCDFSGYSDLSIGIAALMGVSLPDNFNFPYQSLNITEFWRRWHISLSTWFRDYLYIPLGGNRKGKFRTYFNNFFTMIVAGLWHGSTPMFLLWGGLHGTGLVIHKLNKPWLDRIPNNWLTKPFSWTITFLFVVVTFIFFRGSNLEVCEQIFTQIFTNTDFAYAEPFLLARPVWSMLVVGTLLVHATRRENHHRMMRCYIMSPFIFKIILFALVIQLCIQMHTSNVQPFIYYQF